jgi:hypothetical protein
MKNNSSFEMAMNRLSFGRQNISKLVANIITKIPDKQTKNNTTFDLIDLKLPYCLLDSIIETHDSNFQGMRNKINEVGLLSEDLVQYSSLHIEFIGQICLLIPSFTCLYPSGSFNDCFISKFMTSW